MNKEQRWALDFRLTTHIPTIHLVCAVSNSSSITLNNRATLQPYFSLSFHHDIICIIYFPRQHYLSLLLFGFSHLNLKFSFKIHQNSIPTTLININVAPTIALKTNIKHIKANWFLALPVEFKIYSIMSWVKLISAYIIAIISGNTYLIQIYNFNTNIK